MKKQILASLLVATALFAGCDDYNDRLDGFVDNTAPTDVKELTYTLTAADYSAVSSNATNTALAEAAGFGNALKALKTNCYFTDDIPASTYVPAFLKATYFTADEGSSIKLTYDKQVGLPSYLAPLNKAAIYKVSNEDYESIWGASFPFFSPTETAAKHVPGLLKAEYPDAVKDDVVLVDYNLSANEPAGSVVAVNEPFEGFWDATINTATVDGWQNVTTVGTYTWGGRIFSGNCYIQASAYKHTAGALEMYMISPKFTVANGMHLTFDACYGNYVAGGGRLSVLISEDLAGFTAENIAAATWTDITSAVTIPVPTGTYGTLANVCNYDMSALTGKKVYVAFRYNGNVDGATTTVQLDNVVIKSEGVGGEDIYAATTGLFQYDGSAWSAISTAYPMTLADFNAMGSKYDNFSSSMNADNYLPQFLAQKYPYAQEGDAKAVTYKFYNSSTKATSVRTDEYVRTAGSWMKTSAVETVTDQFVLSNGKWNFDPSTTIELLPTKANERTVQYMQAATDWVWENIDKAKLGLTEADKKSGKGYMTSYANNEYYSGCSAYYGNVDMRVANARAQYAKGYEGLEDAAVVALMEEHLIEVMAGTLATLNPDVVPVEGVDVLYTVKVGIYTGTTISACTHQLVYKVTAKGTFEYVKDSFKAL